MGDRQRSPVRWWRKLCVQSCISISNIYPSCHLDVFDHTTIVLASGAASGTSGNVYFGRPWGSTFCFGLIFMRRTLTAPWPYPRRLRQVSIVYHSARFSSDIIYLPESSSKIQLSRHLLTLPYGQFGIPATSTRTMSSSLSTTPLGVVSVVQIVPTFQQSWMQTRLLHTPFRVQLGAIMRTG